MRINKRLSELGVCSRREADRMIEAGRVLVNGEKATMGSQVEPTDEISVDGIVVGENPEPVLLAYHKPRGIVCTTSDKDRAENIVEAIGYPSRIYPIGRLDKESEGLILLTNQGELVNEINRARKFHEKEYVVTVDKPITMKFLKQMEAGVYLTELDETTRPCRIWQDATLSPNRRIHEFHIVITQGLNRQIRRMCEELGYTVKRLIRIRIMKLELGDLKVGEYRDVRPEELGL